MKKIQIQDPGSGMNISDLIFWVKILKFFDTDPGYGILSTLDPGSGMGNQIRDNHPRSAAL
jgi:hypothetical protein